jgi:uncharacterized protein YecT (DUF1311 family)
MMRSAIPRNFDDLKRRRSSRLSWSLAAVLRSLAGLALAAICAGTALAQQSRPVAPARFTCNAAHTAFSRLICADRDLAALNLILNATYRDAKAEAAPDEQPSLLQEQLAWVRDRDQKCGLMTKGFQPIRELLPAKPCLEEAMEARIRYLQYGPDTGSVSQVTAPPPPAISLTPLMQSPTSGAAGAPASNESPPFREMNFVSSADGINGTVKCSSRAGGDDLLDTTMSGKAIVKIAIDDSANSYHMFENDAWEPFVDNLRTAVRSGCANALKTGRLRDGANEPVTELNDVFEVYSPQGLFMAYSSGANTPWVLKKNLPKARKQLKAALGIETWVDPEQLAKNPYFFKGSLVGMVIRFDHMLSSTEAVFSRAGSEVFVSGIPSTSFKSDELMVLAARVIGNKGVISPSGSESLLPSLNYVGAHQCDNSCEGL